MGRDRAQARQRVRELVEHRDDDAGLRRLRAGQGERRYGGVLDEEMLMALPPEFLTRAIAGMEALARNGFRYPFPQYGIQQDVRAGMARSYPDRAPPKSV